MIRTEALVKALVDRAIGAANASSGRRLDAGQVSRDIERMADGDFAAVGRAWDYCVEQFAEGEHLAWLRAATYFIPVLTRTRAGVQRNFRPFPGDDEPHDAAGGLQRPRRE